MGNFKPKKMLSRAEVEEIFLEGKIIKWQKHGIDHKIEVLERPTDGIGAYSMGIGTDGGTVMSCREDTVEDAIQTLLIHHYIVKVKGIGPGNKFQIDWLEGEDE